MAGKTETEAVKNYVAPLQRVVSCATKAVLDVSGGTYASDRPHALTFGDALPQKLKGANVYLAITQRYRVIREEEDPDRGPWRVTIDQYVYTLSALPGRDKSERPETLLSYQWHPHPRAKYNYPHLHLGPASGIGSSAHAAARLTDKSHVPTGRVAVEDVIRFAITQLNVEPLRDDWEQVLDEAQKRHERYRSWGGSALGTRETPEADPGS